MNITRLMIITLVFSLLSFGSTGFAQNEVTQDASATSGQTAAPSEPVTGYQGMLPYIQENAAIRKEASRKYASEKSRKKSKKSKKKSISKKKSRSSASVKKAGVKKKKSPSKRQGSL